MDGREEQDVPLGEDAYVSEEDEDFDPNAAREDENISSSSESSPDVPASGKRGRGRAPKGGRKKRQKPQTEEAEDAGFENSGDEGIIKKGKKRKRKGSVKEDSGGEGGFVKTRSMRAVAEKEKTEKPLSDTDGNSVTLDIDALWKSMKASSIIPETGGPQPPQHSESDDLKPPPKSPAPEDPEMVTITHTYTFAGKTTTKTEAVPRSSAQAKLYLAQKGLSTAPSTASAPAVQKKGPGGQLLYRPLRRVSPWEPNQAGVVANLPTRRDGSLDPNGKTRGLRVVDKSELSWHKPPAEAAIVAAVRAAARAPPKLNVVDKSKLDWVEHVDQEGDREDLEAAAKSKGDYLERKRFLDRIGDKRDEDFAKARRK